MRRLVTGALAHVDAGKTTLSEALLYLTGRIRNLGRVDKGDTHLDTDWIERERGITIFSKQARFTAGETEVCLLDTPGHVDFSAEMERTLQVLDLAVLVISGTDGVQAHTQTLWRLLRRYGIPTFLFVTKMDLAVCSRDELLRELKAQLSDGCTDFTDGPDEEELALLDEELMEAYLDGAAATDEAVQRLVRSRRAYPCYFGSGLKLEGVEALLQGLDRYAPTPCPGPEFGAKVYKIMRDSQGARLTCMRITGGSLRVRTPVRCAAPDGSETEEKVSQIRLYSGAKFETADECPAGCVCAVTGLTATFPGQGLGAEPDSAPPMLEPVMTYRLLLKDCDPMTVLPKLRVLEEEEPLLHLHWDAHLRQIQIQLMGQVQIEVLRSVIQTRFGIDAELDAGQILYRETIADAVEGVGHFEPLRHYAEVHLLLEPGEPGSGLVFRSDCPEDALDRNWQRLILTHLVEKQHLGVLTGSPITDLRITLRAGRAHVKHTEGGDFRQATYRAVRQGLMQAKSVLLEPWYDFTLTVPSEQLGRAINDIRMMEGVFSSPAEHGGMSVLTGRAPVSELRGYAPELMAYTRGRGSLSCSAGGYRPCHNAQKVIGSIGYDPERDVENTPNSVFCAHGAGITVKWDRVPEYMHLESCLRRERDEVPRLRSFSIDERELEKIMEREFGPIKRPSYAAQTRSAVAAASVPEKKREYLIVDGYNVIFAWDELRALASGHLDAARQRLMELLANYRGYTKCELVLVFDAYRVAGNAGSRTDYHGIHVVFTKEGETGDAYIERLTHDIGRNFAVRVVTSDSLIQLSALRAGVLRVSAREFQSEVEWVLTQIGEILRRSNLNAHKTRDAVRGLSDGT